MSLTLEAKQSLTPETVETGNPVDSLITDFRQDQIEMLERCRQCAMSRLTNPNEIRSEWVSENCEQSGCNVVFSSNTDTGQSGHIGECIGKCG